MQEHCSYKVLPVSTTGDAEEELKLEQAFEQKKK